MGGRSGSSYLKTAIYIIRILMLQIKWTIVRFFTSHIDTYTCLVGKTAIVTGGSSGIGYATAAMLASRGCKIIIATNVECEKEKNKLIETTNNPNITTKYLDLGSLDSVRKFAEDIKKTETKIDFLVNNAGVTSMKEGLSKDGLNNVMQINYLGHFLLTHLLIDELKAAGSARVVSVASSAANLHQMNPDRVDEIPRKKNRTTPNENFKYYINSKLCTIVASQELAKKLNPYGITVVAVDPGIIHTGMVQAVFDIKSGNAKAFKLMCFSLISFYGTDTYTAAKNTIFALTGKNVNNGDLYFQCHPMFKPHNLENAEFCRKIIEKSEVLVGLKSEDKYLEGKSLSQ